MKYLKVGLLGFAMMSSGAFASGDHDHDHGAKTPETPKEMNHDMHKGMNHGSMKGMDHGSHDMGASSDHHAQGMGHGASMVGKPGIEEKVTKVINVEANDQMRFVHKKFEAKVGETIKFVVKNTGKIMHEFAVGTQEEHMAHGKMMMNNPNMHHGASSGVIKIEPGETEILIWEFSKPMSAQLACNVPGHYQAGMHSEIHIKK